MEVTLEQGLEGFKGLSQAEKSVPGMCESKHNGSEAREYLMCWRLRSPGGRNRADKEKVREHMRSEQMGSGTDIAEHCTLCYVKHFGVHFEPDERPFEQRGRII